MTIPSIETVFNLSGKRVLVRCSFNVPLLGKDVVDDFRLKKILPTIQLLRDRGAKVLLMGHIGRDPVATLAPINDYLNKQFPVTFLKSFKGEETTSYLKTMRDGDVVLFENLRRDPREAANDSEFAKELASLADIYVNEAFTVSHREHASIVGVAKHVPSYAGIRFSEEVAALSKTLDPESPFVLVLGGAKFDTKWPLIQKFIDIADQIVIGGALANDIFVKQGFEVGTSLLSENPVDMDELLMTGKVHIPKDVVVRRGGQILTTTPDKVLQNDYIGDAGPETIKELAPIMSKAKTILWNGPLGNYEEKFKEGTLGLARIISESDAVSVVGGGDTLAAIQELDLHNGFTFISTGGGAMLQFLADETLPGIRALQDNHLT
ncbi:phosphoglycerate kinase [Candidatus Wolfebacteria bacterium]|nr:MAG: phosphoglycerate kinase [Candidatus Wolfebacteria bacterium]